MVFTNNPRSELSRALHQRRHQCGGYLDPGQYQTDGRQRCRRQLGHPGRGVDHTPLLLTVRYLSETRGDNVKQLLIGFLGNEAGQDLIEYTLLLAFVCLATAALFISSGGSLSGIWNQANSRLTTANTAAAS